VSWTAKEGDETRGFVGHFDSAGQFVTDTPGGIRLGHGHRHGGRASLIDARVPVSSSCTADPFTQDGANCTPGDLNAPFYTFTTAGSPQRLFAQAATEGPNCVIFFRCHLRIRIHHHRADILSRLREEQSVGILVQRIKGHHLQNLGRVPLGKQGKGRLKLRWNLKVNGKRLHKGRYRVTLRAVTKHHDVLGLTRPVTIRVR